MDDTSGNPLQSTVQRSSRDCPQFRILLVGKTGCGKSSLINKVFGIDVAKVSHKGPGMAAIEVELCPGDNGRFILHDSRGFESGKSENYDVVKRFIEGRTDRSKVDKERLHAIWICISIPRAGNRLIEKGVKDLWTINRHDTPLIVVFTKYDMLVTDFMFEADDLDSEGGYSYGEMKADAAFKGLCIDPLIAMVGMVPFVKVSTAQDRYKSTIEKLIQETDEQVLQSVNSSSHTSPVSMAWAVAQRGNSDVSMDASIDVGRERYWKGLISSTDFTGKKLRQCLDVIHTDIISVWNIRDPEKYLTGEEFKSTISKLVEDLIPPPRTSVSRSDFAPAGTALATAPGTFGIIVASLWSAAIFAQWVTDVYKSAPDNVACIMGYIVDLTIVMRKLSNFDVMEDISKESIKAVLNDSKDDITGVHQDIREFVTILDKVKLAKKDNVLEEIVKLIHKYCDRSN